MTVNQDQIENLLPLGSVIQTASATHKLLIIGRLQLTPENELYQYLGVPWPEGYLNREMKYLFNQDDIDEVFFTGYQSPEESRFKKEVLSFLTQPEQSAD